MRVREKTPEKILVNIDFLKSAISEEKERRIANSEYENNKNIFLALLGGLTSCVLTLIPSWNLWDNGLKIWISLITGIFLMTTFWFGCKFVLSKKKVNKIGKDIDLAEHVLNEVKQKIRYTALIVICYQQQATGEVKFMTEKQGNYLVHCDMDPHKQIAEQHDSIINYLAASYNINRNQIENIFPMSQEPFFSIKPIHGVETQNGFIFFHIKLKKSAKQNLLNHRDVDWKSIREMEEIPELMGKNQDIVMSLNENRTKIADSFEENYGPVHIIWNITKKCPYDCKICATRDDMRKELSTVEKLQVLNNIFSAREHISTLDFAGGDPMFDEGIRTVIMQAINSLGEERVSVTTTGKGIQAMVGTSDEEMTKLLNRCEITIDASHENLSSERQISIFPRKSPEYCNHNFEQIKNTSDNLHHLIINIPLLDDDLNEEEINNLISKLLKLKQDYRTLDIEAQIIRLMPVGALNSCDDFKEKYKKYQPIELAQKLKTRIEEIGINCRYHCSLRVLQKIGECDQYCNMLDKKIGIDCNGNVFACTWGAYLPIEDNDVTKNPFYLGNLVTTSLKRIFGGQGNKTPAYKRISRDIKNKTSKKYCEAVSWFFKNSIDENNDPLS